MNPDDWCDDPSRGWNMAGRENGSGVEGPSYSAGQRRHAGHADAMRLREVSNGPSRTPLNDLGPAGVATGLPFFVSTDPWLLLTQEAK